MSLRRGDRTKRRNSCVADQSEKATLEETERTLYALKKLAQNPECTSSLVDGLANYMRIIVTVTDSSECPAIEKAISELLNQILQTCYDELQRIDCFEEKFKIFLLLTKLMTTALELLRGGQSLHFTALSIINRIIDICIVHKNHEVSSTEFLQSTDCIPLQPGGAASQEGVSPQLKSPKHKTSNSSPKQRGGSTQCAHNHHDDSATSANNSSNTFQRISSVHFRKNFGGHSDGGGHSEKTDDSENTDNANANSCGSNVLKTPLEFLTTCDPSQILSVLHNSITMHKRIIGTRQKCTPSTRSRFCTHHCLQILSARILVVMCHGLQVQYRIVGGGHIKTLVEALDPNHDPHLLCLLLQSLASIALTPSHHQVLNDADIADMLMQLLLPSDEWYYTNHSTKYAKFVKYHAARILVYMGLLHKLGGRVDLFDRKPFKELSTNAYLQVHSPEDSFIELMAMGQVVMWNDNQHLQAASLEGLVAKLIQEAMNDENEGTGKTYDLTLSSSIQSICGLMDNHCSTMLTPFTSPACSLQFLAETDSKPFRELLLMGLPMLVHPVIILRLLAHKVFGNMIRRKSLFAETKLKPPPPENLEQADMCPPRCNSEAAKFHDIKREVNRRRRSHHPIITKSSSEELDSPATLNSPVERELVKQNGIQSKNGTTQRALRAIGTSLANPSNNNSNNNNTNNSNNNNSNNNNNNSSSNKISRQQTSSASKSRLFHWPSKKRLSKSQSNVSSKDSQDINAGSIDRADSKSSITSSENDIDILAFQRELINLPTFVMDTPATDVSPMFSRCSSVPENLASRMSNNDSTTPEMSTYGSDHLHIVQRRAKGEEFGSDQALCDLPKSPSKVTITTTDFTQPAHQGGGPLTLTLPTQSSIDDVEDNIANITVRFEAPASPISSSSQSPQAFDFQYPFEQLKLAASHCLINEKSSANQVATSSSNFLNPSPTSAVSPTVTTGPTTSPWSPSCMSQSSITANVSHSEIPGDHRGVLRVIETWIRVCSNDLDCSSLIVHEMRDFLRKMSVLGHEYKAWCQKIGGLLHLEEKNVMKQRSQNADDPDNVNAQYKKLQQLVVAGDIPCSKEEAATLASIQLHIEEAWPEHNVPNHANTNPPDLTFLQGGKLIDHKLWAKSTDPQENLRKRKELIRNNRAGRITSSRRKGRLVRQLSCVSSKDLDIGSEVDLTKFLPPDFNSSKKIRCIIQEKQKQLWHTPYYDSEIKLKQQYIKICKNLPSFGCKLYQVKELLRGNTQKKAVRLLGIATDKIVLLDNKTKLLLKTQSIRDLEEWNTGSGKYHDGLVLEFRGTKPWHLSMATLDNLKSVTAVLWDSLDMDGRFLNNGTLRRDSFEFDFHRKPPLLRPALEGGSKYSEELENLQRLLHFPEEVAILLTDMEHSLFNEIPPSHYIRQVTTDLSRGSTVYRKLSSVEDLIQRFNEVSSWVTQLIITQPTHEDRKAILSCILRLAFYCWCLGNFNTTMEIVAGLKSEKLKPFWLSLCDEDLSTLHMLSNFLLSRELTQEYREAVGRGLDIPTCKVVPFFGGFLRELRALFINVPSIIVLPSKENQSLEFISDFNGEDRFMTRIGVGGLINMDKLQQTHTILNDISLFHHHGKGQETAQREEEEVKSKEEFVVEEVENEENDCESDYDLDLDSYQPVQPIMNDHEVVVITSKLAGLSHHWLQCMHHGSTVIHIEDDSCRTYVCYLKLELDNTTLTWRKPSWSSLMPGNTSYPDYMLKGESDSSSTQALSIRYTGGEDVYDTLEEGFVDLKLVKEISHGNEESLDLNLVGKRHSMDDLEAKVNSICILYGSGHLENKRLWFVAPKNVCKIWLLGLQRLIKAAHKLRRQTDKRIQLLKNQYLQLYYDNEKCVGPSPAEAIKVFGGRRWHVERQLMGTQDVPTSFKRTGSFVTSKIFNKKSSTGFSNSKESSPRGSGSIVPNMSSSDLQKMSSQKGHRTPSPLRKNKLSDLSKSSVPCSSDPNLHQNQTTQKPNGSPRLGFRPRSMTFSFTNRYRSKRRRMSLGMRSTDNKMTPITDSSQLTFLDFVDLFKSFSLRCRRDLKDLYEQLALTMKPTPGKDIPTALRTHCNSASTDTLVEAINKSAFVMSPYPVIMSIENHCSIIQQQKMALIFQSVFGEKLVTTFLFESDFCEDPQLPSPCQLKFKILVKYKKIRYQESYTLRKLRTSVDSQDSQTGEQDDKGRNSGSSRARTDSFLDYQPSSGSFGEKSRPKSHPDLDWQFEDDIQEMKTPPKTKQKKASQIAKELSDLVIYLQAIKFRGLTVSPNTSMRRKPAGKKVLLGSNPGTPPLTSDKTDMNMFSGYSRQRRPDSTPPCYLVSSLNESKAKQHCRRNPIGVINHTEKQLMRTYPAGMRIDSSNFNPVIFWAFGIQMVALNYQTEDTAMILNTAMFEQNGQSGYVLKPATMWDKSHMMYNHFNPWDKTFDGLHATVLTIHVISGQYVSNNHTASTYIEVELLGIPVDSAKHKTKVVPRNALNPIWNDYFTFHVMFADLAFLRFVVVDANTSHMVSQRIIPLKCLRAGYRHVRLRSPTNQPLELATVFINSKHEEESLLTCSTHDINGCHDSASAKRRLVFAKNKDINDKDAKELSPTGARVKRRMFFISVFGVNAPDKYVILKVTQDTTVYDTIAQALMKAGRAEEKVTDYVLVEEVQSGWERSMSQRILDMMEKVLIAQNQWKGAGKFLLRKLSDDPSSRAWMTTMLSIEHRRKVEESADTADWDSVEQVFLVCVYNVAPDQPYTIFKAPTSSSAQDIVTQAMMKAHRTDTDNLRKLLLVEELEMTGTESLGVHTRRHSGEHLERRILAPDENVYHAQSEWITNGKFVIMDQAEYESSENQDKKKGKSAKLKSEKGNISKQKSTKRLSKSSSVPPEKDLFCSATSGSSSGGSSIFPDLSQVHLAQQATPKTTSKLKKFSAKFSSKSSR
ncbi:uncharacterized protein LOC110449213 [Mizuhopecten yessoensis]|uniref:uncharacterized protein LOC110449213 n=1 Tax=Mizuhopecten yessoensis TaxID=6573 RepID=UPI000B45AE54|nr:uncharacterized protein LOC110449213 [Mizuhopecten yessoensis]